MQIHRQGEDKRRGTTRCKAHLWSQEEPIRDALELVHVVYLLSRHRRGSPPATRWHERAKTKKGGKNISSTSRYLLASVKYSRWMLQKFPDG
jgi:hypothetical protein